MKARLARPVAGSSCSCSLFSLGAFRPSTPCSQSKLFNNERKKNPPFSSFSFFLLPPSSLKMADDLKVLGFVASAAGVAANAASAAWQAAKTKSAGFVSPSIAAAVEERASPLVASAADAAGGALVNLDSKVRSAGGRARSKGEGKSTRTLPLATTNPCSKKNEKHPPLSLSLSPQVDAAVGLATKLYSSSAKELSDQVREGRRLYA